MVQVDLVGLGQGPGQVVARGLAQVQVGGVLGSTGAGPAPGAGGAGVAALSAGGAVGVPWVLQAWAVVAGVGCERRQREGRGRWRLGPTPMGVGVAEGGDVLKGGVVAVAAVVEVVVLREAVVLGLLGERGVLAGELGR